MGAPEHQEDHFLLGREEERTLTNTMTITELPKTETLTRKDFLDNMIAYYSEDPVHRRSKDEKGWCCYRDWRGNKCAIGRWIPDESYCKSMEGFRVCAIMEDLPSHVQALGEDFLMDVQQLHDGDHNWCETGLSNEGKVKLGKITKKYLQS